MCVLLRERRSHSLSEQKAATEEGNFHINKCSLAAAGMGLWEGEGEWAATAGAARHTSATASDSVDTVDLDTGAPLAKERKHGGASTFLTESSLLVGINRASSRRD